MPNKLMNKVALVTGASKGIGASIAMHFAAEGAAVVVNYASSQEDARRVVDKIARQGGKALAVKADLTHPADIDKLFSKTLEAFGKLDVLVNNAGVYAFAALEDITSDHFYQMFDLNVWSLLFATQKAVQFFSSTGGVILNISSVASTLTRPNSSVYSASKAAVDAITKCLSKELGPRNIRVNALNPGMIETEGVRHAGLDQGEFRQAVEAQTPLGRIGIPQDIASAAVFLASDDASWITGETLVVAGGLR